MADTTPPTDCHSITSFITAFKGGTRLNRFKVTGGIGANRTADDTGAFHIRSATIPEAQVGAIAINHRGRTVAYPGDRAYEPWQITILDDTGDNNLHKLFHDWHNFINAHETNKTQTTPTTTTGTSTSTTTTTTSTTTTTLSPSDTFVDSWTVEMLDVNGSSLPNRKFTLKNVWPATVGPIQLDMSQDNTLASFAVTLIYSHYTYGSAGAATTGST
jgi:hypothetical protein